MLSKHFIQYYAKDLALNILNSLIENEELLEDTDKLYMEFRKHINLIKLTTPMQIMLKYMSKHNYKTYNPMQVFEETIDKTFKEFVEGKVSSRYKNANVILTPLS